MSATIASAGFRVFETVELLTLICQYTAPSECVKILLSSKLGFEVGAPFVWNHVDGAVKLLRLLPGAWTSKDAMGEVKVFMFHTSPDTHPTRFALYAPLVKSIRINKQYQELCTVRGWYYIYQRVRNQPLLPNLKTLMIDRCAVAPPFTHCTQAVMWTIALLSPSLETLNLICEEEEQSVPVPYLAASAIMSAVLEVCPAIRKLSLFPAVEIEDESDELFPLLNLLHTRPFLSYFSDLRNLSELVTSTHMLSPEALRVLGDLPRLKRLTFQEDLIEDMGYPDDLPSSAFSALEHLAVRGLEFGDTEDVLTFLPLVRKITSLEVETSVVDDDEVDPDGGEGENTLADRLFRCLADIPHLTNLNINLGDTEYVPLGPRDINVPFICNVLSRLPLHVVELRGLIFGDIEVLGTTFPVLTKLALPNQSEPLSLLSRYTAIPDLDHLVLFMTADDQIPTGEDVPSFRSLHTLELIRMDSGAYSSKQRHSITERLRKRFPSLQHVIFRIRGPKECEQ
ncbi:hypothetical protein BDV93DRAFT_607732 [Ceratobasidium sp. AG-I]|nr:hypothetical protein BDV93DRAFT_607732 [Ceratobasidium sp. AG-I]